MKVKPRLPVAFENQGNKRLFLKYKEKAENTFSEEV